MLKILKRYLLRIVEDIDAGNTDLSEKELEQVIELIKDLGQKDQILSKYEACRYLNISRATFDNYVRQHKLPRGQQKAGFKEVVFLKKDLDNFINTYRNNK